MRLLDVQSPTQWNDLIQKLPSPHILQTWEWGQSKIKNGWTPAHYIWEDDQGALLAAALILSRKISVGLPGLFLKVLYCPKGPSLDWTDQALVPRIMDDLQNFARDQKAVFIKMDPDVPLGWGVPGSNTNQDSPEGLAFQADLKNRGWRFSEDQIQFRNTVLIDLTPSEDQLLSAMKQKTRYNIHLAQRKGVRVRLGQEADLGMLYQMYATTAVRDGFVIRHEEYYTSLWRDFLRAGLAHILISEVAGQPVAGLILFHFAGISRYMFGMSLETQRELMPNYLLQWEAIRTSKALGCHTYDLWGAPDVFDQSDTMWGVYRFKEGFNGLTTRHLGAWDYTTRPGLYHSYTQTLPKILALMRTRGKAENRKRTLP
ncbi:MAG: peptidoglycan bridge formation glycyltransferase FemA/FemB family protein [Anaerolineaceae bacterium]